MGNYVQHSEKQLALLAGKGSAWSNFGRLKDGSVPVTALVGVIPIQSLAFVGAAGWQ